MRVLIVHGTIFAWPLSDPSRSFGNFPGVLHSWGRGARVDELAHGGPMAGISTHSAGQLAVHFLCFSLHHSGFGPPGVFGKKLHADWPH